jgi:hypothetical protein
VTTRNLNRKLTERLAQDEILVLPGVAGALGVRRLSRRSSPCMALPVALGVAVWPSSALGVGTPDR